MGKPTELMQLLKTGNSDAARKLIAKLKKSGNLLEHILASQLAIAASVPPGYRPAELLMVATWHAVLKNIHCMLVKMLKPLQVIKGQCLYVGYVCTHVCM